MRKMKLRLPHKSFACFMPAYNCSDCHDELCECIHHELDGLRAEKLLAQRRAEQKCHCGRKNHSGTAS